MVDMMDVERTANAIMGIGKGYAWMLAENDRLGGLSPVDWILTGQSVGAVMAILDDVRAAKKARDA